jgi:NAD(P)-dependent dehydrogenase (short-subunit alcohol dehydrogenase family)
MPQDSPSKLLDLTGQVACVTGAGRGIGESIARLLASAGAAVLVTDINGDEAAEVAAAIVEDGGKAVGLKADAGRVAEAQRVVDACVDSFGGVDILVNNAGLFEPGHALDITEEAWDRMNDVDLKGVFFHAQAAARQMVADGRGGRIVNIASLAALHPSGVLVVYEAAKGGVLALTRSLAREWGQYGINVNAVAPGATASPGSEQTRVKMQALMGTDYPHETKIRSVFGRIGQPADIANATLYLASPMASYVTGETLIVDGGYWLL